MALPQKLEADTRCHAKLPTDQELLYHGCGSTVRVSIEEAGLARARRISQDHNTTRIGILRFPSLPSLTGTLTELTERRFAAFTIKK